MTFRTILFAAAMAAATVGLTTAPSTVSAQQADARETGAHGLPGSDDALDAMAHAYVEVRAAEARYRLALMEAASADEAMALRREMERSVRHSLDTHGLSAEEFDAMVAASREDRELRSELSRRIEALERARPAGGV